MADKYKIKWNGLVDDDEFANADNNEVPESVNLGTWKGYTDGYVPCWYGVTDNDYSECEAGIPSECHANPANCFMNFGKTTSLYFEDFNLHCDDCNESHRNYPDFGGYGDWSGKSTIMFWYQLSINQGLTGTGPANRNPDPGTAPKKTYTWGDVSFVLEIFDGIGTGSRKSREARLQKLDKDKKKKLIRLICRVKGEEKAYDETKETGNIELKLDDVDMVISKVIGTMKVSTEWKEVDWDYKYDK